MKLLLLPLPLPEYRIILREEKEQQDQRSKVASTSNLSQIYIRCNKRWRGVLNIIREVFIQIESRVTH